MKKILFLPLFFIFGCTLSEIEVKPLPPSDLILKMVSKDLIELTWTDNSTNETGFKIERKIDSGNFVEIGSTGKDVTIFSDREIILNTNYAYRIYSLNNEGKSISYSNEATIKTINFPTLTTTTPTEVTFNSAKSGGLITLDGGSPVNARGVVWNTIINPTVSLPTKTINDNNNQSGFESLITDLEPNVRYYLRAYATNAAGTGYGDEILFTTRPAPILPSVSTTSVTEITVSSAKSGGTITLDGYASITAKGIVWSTTTSPTIALSTKTIDGNGPEIFQSSITGLRPSTKYFVRAYATNSVGTSYGNEVSFFSPFVFNTVIGVNGRIWLDRNLGASQVATSSTDNASFGDLYQWGRRNDGHQLRSSGSITNLSSTDQPNHGDFIFVSNSPWDWRSPQNNNLWQGLNGTNNPCPTGFRIPTEVEWDLERSSWSTNSSVGAFASPLKLPMAGVRNGPNTSGQYWSSSISGTKVRDLLIDSSNAYMNANDRARGFSVRCIKD